MADSVADHKLDNNENTILSKIKDFRKEYKYISICTVYISEKFLERWGDIKEDGTIEPFTVNDKMPRTFGNRKILYYSDGPKEEKTIGIWAWSPLSNINDSSKDYIKSTFLNFANPNEIIIISGLSKDGLLDALYNGLALDYVPKKGVIATEISKGNYYGLGVQDFELLEIDSKYKLKDEVLSLPEFVFNQKDIIALSNEKHFFLHLGFMPSGLKLLANQMLIVKNVILGRASWNAFKQAGLTRKEWHNVYDFLDNMDVTDVVKNIAEQCMVSEETAGMYLIHFMGLVDQYVKGETIEDEVIAAVAAVSTDVQNRANQQLRESWEEENQEKISTINHEIQELESTLEKRKTDYAALDRSLKEQEKELRDKINKLNKEYQSLEEQVQKKQTFAKEMEESIAVRMQKAKEHVAEFTGEMMFLHSFLGPAKESMTESVAEELGQERAIGTILVAPVVLDELVVEEVTNWKDALEMLQETLENSGVSPEYSCSLGAFLYSSYMNQFPVLLAGPNASQIVDAFSVALFGRTAYTLDFQGKYNPQVFQELTKEDSSSETTFKVPVKVVDFLEDGYVSKISDMLDQVTTIPFFIHPFAEDVQIEPRSLFSFVLPLFTEIFVEKRPNKTDFGGRLSKNFTSSLGGKTIRISIPKVEGMQMNALVRNNLQTVLAYMYKMLNSDNSDNTLLFGLFPYAYATMQMEPLLQMLENAGNKGQKYSKKLVEDIVNLYGK